ncbi:patched domain-containing protein 3-like [Tachypleus tridentatus]|uniref:patched domain-containing protein 3-like n=1 Tax=Tachypleus tridentatus TaxID=6853 RepID=UPI003FD61723
MKLDCVDKATSKVFMKLGQRIGHSPGYFIIVPLLVAALFSTGIQRIKYQDNPEYLFSPINGRSRSERKTVEKYFHVNTSENFDLGRLTRPSRLGRLIVVAKDGGSVLTKSVFKELVHLDDIIQNLNITWKEETYTYKDLCAKVERNSCFENNILDFKEKIKDIEEGRQLLQYPVMINKVTQKRYNMAAFLGGVQTDELGFVEQALAFNLFYPLDTDIKNGKARAKLWEQIFLQTLEDLQLEEIVFGYFVSDTLESELEKNTQSVKPYFIVTFLIMIVFSILACVTFDAVRSKPWLGVLGCFSTCMSLSAAFGLVIYCGLDFIGINLAAPFLMLGIGMDDTFVLLAAWRRTNPKHSVEDRMGDTYAEAAVSITITTLTNFISFLVGVITPFPSVQIFCIYTAIAVLFTYIWHITFFGSCLAVSGYAEKRNLHGVVCIPTTPKSLAKNRGFFFRICCTGGINDKDPENLDDKSDIVLMSFFRDGVGGILTRFPVKLIVIFIFMGYLAVGLWGCTMVKEGLERHKLSRFDSYSVLFYALDDKYFRKHPYRIQIVVEGEIDYVNAKVQEVIENMLKAFEDSDYISNSSLTESWLRAYSSFQNDGRTSGLFSGLNMSNSRDFIIGLKDVFLRLPLTKRFKQDIVFNKLGTAIIASRFLVQSENIFNANQEKNMLVKLREIADSYPFKTTVFNQYFLYWDQFILVRETSIQAISVAAAVMMVISLLFIPSISCAVWVAFSIISIEIGVIGYMTLWEVNLDSISMINLIMCIGFSVDFSAHISYSYISVNNESSNDRIKKALYSLGTPILQGSISTILGVLSLAFAPSYIFKTFFKTMFLVILFGALHGVLLLPVLLSLSDYCCSKTKHKDTVTSKIGNPMFINPKDKVSIVGSVGKGSKPLTNTLPSKDSIAYRDLEEERVVTWITSSNNGLKRQENILSAEKDLEFDTNVEENRRKSSPSATQPNSVYCSVNEEYDNVAFETDDKIEYLAAP